MREKNDLKVRFTYHTPRFGQPEKYEHIRDKAKEFASLLCYLCPESSERSNAIQKIEEAVFWANAAIARREKVRGA
jgi:hypothetical protein